MQAVARSSRELLEARDRNIPRGIVTAHPVTVARARGSELWDAEGRRYLDFVGGIGVLNVGHSHPRVVEAVADQVRKVSHVAFQVAAYEPYVALAERLNGLVGGGEPHKTIFLTTGAEAVENAIKIARGHTNRPGVIAFRGGFHGRTLLGVTLTGMSQPYRQNFGPLPAEIHHVDFPDPFHGVLVQKCRSRAWAGRRWSDIGPLPRPPDARCRTSPMSRAATGSPGRATASRTGRNTTGRCSGGET